MANTRYSASKYTVYRPVRWSPLLNRVPRVIDGADSTLDTMEKVPVGAKNRPITEIKLYNVGSSYDPAYLS